MKKGKRLMVVWSMVAMLAVLAGSGQDAAAQDPLDALGNPVELEGVSRVICSGPGCLRLLVYLQAGDSVVAVDDIEVRKQMFDARPYALANPQFKELPIFGEFRGHDNPELILTLDPQPQVIFKTYAGMGHDPGELQEKTGIPVIPLQYGDLLAGREQLYASLRIMGQVLGRMERAEEVVSFFESQIDDLVQRTSDIQAGDCPSVFLGGVAHKGPHGFQSTEPAYPPFAFVTTNNLARTEGGIGENLAHADMAKEQIVAWNPDYLFLDLSTLQMGEDAGGLYELRNDPAYRNLDAVRQGQVFGMLPYNWYTQNFGSVLANAWYLGTLLHPDRFQGVDPAAKADEIYTFLVGAPEFAAMNELFQGLVFRPVPVN